MTYMSEYLEITGTLFVCLLYECLNSIRRLKLSIFLKSIVYEKSCARSGRKDFLVACFGIKTILNVCFLRKIVTSILNYSSYEYI